MFPRAAVVPSAPMNGSVSTPGALPRASALLWALPGAKLLLHLVTYRGYGFFRDEFYYIACSQRLAFGYVDQPPLSLVLLRAVRALFGDSLFAVRLLPAVAGAGTILLTGLMARRLGGGRFAQALAMVAALAAPIYLGLDQFYSMNAFDLLFWSAAAYILIRIFEGADPRLWLLLGVVLGLGLENKISVLWLGFGLLAGLLASSHRRLLLTAWPWIAGGLAALLFLPHLLWQVANGWPTLEFIRNATSEKMAVINPLDFIQSQILMMNPLTLPIWLAGLGWFLVGKEGRRFRPLGWIYVVVLVVLLLPGTSRAGYLAPAYTWLLAAGALVLERLFARWGRGWLERLSIGLLVLGGAALAPFALPILPVETYIDYAAALGIGPSTAERKELTSLPQHYADMHGWDRIVETVAGVYDRLSPEEQKKAVFFTFNYGDAGAIDLLGRARGLPPALSGHNNYWLWGPRGYTGEIVIVLGSTEESLSRRFERVERAATVDCGYCMPYENNRPVWVCRGMREPLAAIWPGLKHYD